MKAEKQSECVLCWMKIIYLSVLIVLCDCYFSLWNKSALGGIFQLRTEFGFENGKVFAVFWKMCVCVKNV